MFYSFGGLLLDLLASAGLLFSTTVSTPGVNNGTIPAFGALIGMPFIFAFWGFLADLPEAFFYNLITKIFGPIKIDFIENTNS